MKHLPNAVVEIVHRSLEPSSVLCLIGILKRIGKIHPASGIWVIPVLCGGYQMLHTENGSLVKANADFLSLSRLLCLHQGGADSGGQTEAHLRITETGYRQKRGSTFLIQSAADSSSRIISGKIISRLVLIRPRFAISRYLSVNKRRISSRQLLIGKPHTLQRILSVVRYKDVGLFQQPVHHFPAFFRLEV